MPSFESLILSSPTGFIAGCNEINTIDNDIFMNILEIAIKKVYTGDLVTNVNNNSYIFTALLYLINSYKLAYPQPTPQQFASILDNNTTLSRNIIATIIESIEKFSKEEAPNGTIFESPNGTLFDFRWRLGVALCSNKCKDLQSPYIAISFKVKNNNNNVNSYTAELTYKEFCDFQSNFRQVAEIMDSM